MVRQRRLLGTATTDENGVATLTYTGTGVGLIQFEADVTASNVTYTSETIEIGDWLFYDSGFNDSTTLNNMYTLGSAVSRSSDDNGTKLTVANATISTHYQQTNTTFTGDFEATFHFETVEGTTGTRFGVISGSTRRYALRNAGNRYMKLQRINGVTKIYSSDDNENWSESTMNGTEPSSNTVSIYFGMYNTTSTPTSIVYDDLKVKSI